jgi:Cu/Ag efflux pump CusA
MIQHTIKLGMIYVFLLVLLTACGHPIPAAPNDLLSHKKSVLVLTSTTLDNQLQKNLIETLNAWKQSEQITSQWIKSINVVDELIVNQINKTAYSYIIVIGNELSPTALTAAAQTPEKLWSILSDTVQPELNPPNTPVNVALYQLNKANLAAERQKWLNQQQNLGINGQLNSVQSVTYQTINGGLVPAVDVLLTQGIVWNWNAVLAEQLKVIQTDNFVKGIHYYNSGQFVINPE